MIKTQIRGILLGLAFCLIGSVPLRAAPVSWVDWTSGTPGAASSATGVLTFGATTVNVSYSGEIAFIQTSGGGNFWSPSAPYISALVDNAPPASDIIALSLATPKTLTFSQPINNLFFAVVSLNGNGYSFDQDFDIVSYGAGYWGNGTLTKVTNVGSGGETRYQLNGSGEPHGVIRFTGVVSSITWTSLSNEYWNGFTIGTYGLGDVTPPETSITGGPAEGAVSSPNVTFSWSGTDNMTPPADLLFGYKMDGGAWSTYSSETSHAFTGLPEGSHAFSVRAKDSQNNESLPFARTFTVDATPPTVMSTSPADSAVDVNISPVITASFSDPMTASTITSSTFVVKDNADTSVLGTVSYNAATQTASFTASQRLIASTVYTATIAAGVMNARENALASPYSWSFTTIDDTAPPDTQITAGIAEGGTLCTDSATFTFTGTDDTTQTDQLQYAWRLDGGDWSGYSSATSQGITGLSAGTHTFEVAAKDAFDKVDPTPAVRNFKVDLAPPVISSVAANPAQLQAAVSWLTDKDATSQVEYGPTDVYGSSTGLDARLSITHSVMLTGLGANSVYHYRVKSKDNCGRETASPDATFTTSPDAAPPNTDITSGPAEGTGICGSSVTFGYTGTDDTTRVDGLVYAWRMDSGSWSEYSSNTSAVVNGLSHGSHTFEVAARDAFAKVDPTPAIRHFSVDLNPPAISTVAATPSQAQAFVTWTTDEPSDSQVEYGPSAAYGSASPVNSQLVISHNVTITGLDPNRPYHYRVKSKDRCGLESVSTDSTFNTLVDDGTPETEINAGPAEGGVSCSTTVNIGWTGRDSVTPTDKLVYSWKLDSAAWSDYTSDTSHLFTGLAEGGHVFYVRAKDTSGNVDATPSVRHFTVDLASPTVSGITSAQQASRVTVSWLSSKPATSQVEYGPTTSYGSSTSIDSSLVTSHSVAVTGLTPEKTYHFRVKSKDGCGREVASNDGTFTTTSDTNVPNTSIASGPAEGGKACSPAVTICWSGDDDSTPISELQYSYKLDTDAWSDWTSDTCHDYTGLTEGPHVFSVRAKDTAGNIDATPAVRNFKVDTTAPTVSNILLAPRQSSVTASWITSEPTTAQVEYGTDTTYGSRTWVDSNMTTSHKVTVSGLIPETAYHMRVRSGDGCLEAVSDDQTVTTTAVIPPNLVPQNVTTPMSTSPGQEISVSWTVQNTGGGDAPTGWMDGFYLSDDENLDGLDVPLGEFARAEGLSGLFAYNNTQNIKMPLVAPGLHYIILEVDDTAVVGETNETDNLYIQAINFTTPKQLVLAPGQMQTVLNPGVAVTGQLDVSNMGVTALNGLTATVEGASANIDIQIEVPDKLDPLTAKKVGYTITASDESVLQSSPVIRIRSIDGPEVAATFFLYVIPRQPRIVANPGHLEAGMIRGKQATIDCAISNTGAVPANDLQVNLPAVGWLALISPRELGTLAPGETAKISLLLKPAADLPLGPYAGNFAVAGSNGGVSVGFTFNAISDQFGGLKVIANDEFSFFADDHPNVTDATVTLTDAVNGNVVFEAMTDDTGVVLREGIPEGHYNLEVKAYKHSTYRAPVLVVAGQVQEIKAFMRRQMVTYSWNVEPVQIEDKYKITLEAVFETHVPAPVVTVDPPFQLIPVLEGHTTEVDYTITNHGLIAAQGVNLSFGDSDEFYIVPLIRDIGTLAAESSIVVPVLIRAKSDGPIPELPSVAINTAAAQSAMAAYVRTQSVIRTAGDGGDDNSKPCSVIVEGEVYYYYKCVNNVPVAIPINTTLLKIGKEIYDILSCGFDALACAGGLATAPEGGAVIAAAKCPDAVRCMFKYACQVISANLGTPCCFCKMVSAVLGDTGEMPDAIGCLPKPSLKSSKPRDDGGGGGIGIGIGFNPTDNGFPVSLTPWDFGTGVPGPCAGMPIISSASANSNLVKTESASSASGKSSAKSQSDISKYGGKEVRYRVRCF